MLRKIPLFFLGILLISVTSCSTAKKASASKKTATASAKPKKKPKKGDIQPYNKVITKDAKSDTGLFTVHEVSDKYFYEIPDSLFNREMLMVTRIAKTASGLGFGGGKQNTQVLRWEKNKKKVLLRVVSHSVVAADSLPVHEAVVNSNFEPILYAFPIKAFSKDSLNTVIEVTPLFKKDVKALGIPQFRRRQYKISRLDDSRSYIDKLKSYPLNIEARHVKTYNAGRVGWFARGQVDYGLDAQESKQVRFLDRWRLEVRDEDVEKFKRGELVVPKKQIVYYVDRATPEEWKPYIKQGIEDWQVAFEAAGFKEAIIAKDPPTVEEDPDWSPEDVRYSVVRYLASPIPNANGPHVSDPRSGEILESDINWYHNVMTLLRNWFFIQTAAINPDAQSMKFKSEVMGRLIRFVSAHEVGHTLGLPHNMGSSVAYPVEKLRDAAFTQKYGTAPSIMDYARFNYVAQPGDEGVADKYAINWGYRPILDVKTANDEKATLDKWILEKAGDPMYRFGAQQGRDIVDPSSQTEDIGDDAMKASDYGIKNLKRIVPNLIKWTAEDGKNYDDLDVMYRQVLGQFNRYMGHVSSNIGGVYQYNKTYDQEGAVYTHVAKADQKRALKFINDQLFTTPQWLLDENIFNKTKSFGITDRIRAAQVRALNTILSLGRLSRVMENEALNTNEAYALIDLMGDLRAGIWSELRSGRKIDAYRRNLQRAHIDRLAYLMTAENQSGFGRFGRRNTPLNTSQSDLRAVVRAELNTLKRNIRSAIGRTSDSMSKIHLRDAVERIDAILDPK